MFRKLFWLSIVVTMVFAVTGLVDRRQAQRRRELWAEATRTD